jgi:hypothetical protein
MYKPAGLPEIKKALKTLQREELVDLISTICKANKFAKEVVTFKLFHEQESSDSYVEKVNNIILDTFNNNYWGTYRYAAKSLRKVSKVTTEHLRVVKQPEQQLAIHLFLCKQLKAYDINEASPGFLGTFYERKKNKALQLFDKLHEDLKMDFEEEVSAL